MNFALEQLYSAYRKAKKEAFCDTNCAHGLKFAMFEQSLAGNLSRLLRQINRPTPTWHTDIDFLGTVTCIPKSVEPPEQQRPPIHCQSSDPLEQWRRQCSEENRAEADFRPVINASVEFMIISALWVLEVGHLYDEKLDTRYAVGNRLRRWRPEPDAPAGTPGGLNTLSPDLFQPYFSAYGKWRTAGLRAMRRELEEGHRVVAVTMDLKRFYHQVDAQFLLHEDYLEEVSLTLTADQRAFTQHMIDAFTLWNQTAHEQFGCEPRGLPVGLTASGLIANVLLCQFDRHVVSRLDPSYYARYVDDVFLVLRHSDPFADGGAFLRWLGERLNPIATAAFQQEGEDRDDRPALRVELTYGDGSELLFVGKKQKIFQLEGPHGIDLIGPIEEQIRQQTSEHRDLPHLPDTESRMAHRALLVTSDATLNADALRKADAVTLRRSGFALLLGDVEAHVRDLDPGSWIALRHQFYELAHRHLLTPSAFFDYLRYFPRVVGIMACCGDWEHASRFVFGFRSLLVCLRQTCESENERFEECLQEACDNLAARMIEEVLRSLRRGTIQSRELLRQIRTTLSPACAGPTAVATITTACDQLLRLDWSRRSYASHWLEATHAETPPARPRQNAVRELLPFRAIDGFREAANLVNPHWPALAFPTRPIPMREITARAPSLLHDGELFATVVRGLRGTWIPEQTSLSLTPGTGDGPQELVIPNATNIANWRPRIAITSIEVSDEEWAGAADGTPRLTLARYRRLNAILDAVAASRQRPDYVILPECSLPRRWAMQMVGRMLPRGVSVVAGLEYRPDTSNANALHNEALVALRTNFLGYPAGLFLLQPKRQPAWHERQLLAESFGKSLAPPPPESLNHPVYHHQSFCFGVLICSELTDIANRQRFQGQVDALFIPEWNQDIESFATLVEASAIDVHAYIVQANNRRYGDSRMRGPLRVHYLRDLIRVKGGLNDYFVIGEIEHVTLRQFQSHAVPPSGEGVRFKPFPIGFPSRLSAARRTTPL
ncbi:MAG: Reverse transcriptase (RNA-dependent DNA polymerase) [Verrucomicrobia bacterium]|nr:MAG: Reverse transcriptase (RNA-dependent DNA polymerase) [Verrucomicrobiota bacterium]